jgi:phosphatidylglycerophosphatase A
LPGGWGITIDDVLAAVYVNVVVVLVYAGKTFL